MAAQTQPGRIHHLKRRAVVVVRVVLAMPGAQETHLSLFNDTLNAQPPGRFAALKAHYLWEAPRSTAKNVRASLLRELYLRKGERVVEDRPRVADGLEVFRVMRRLIGDQLAVVILDEFPWAVEAEPTLPSYLKRA
jgi:hypothetical protein